MGAVRSSGFASSFGQTLSRASPATRHRPLVAVERRRSVGGANSERSRSATGGVRAEGSVLIEQDKGVEPQIE